MKNLTTSALIASFVIVQPVNATEILPLMQRSENPVQFIEQILCPSGMFSTDEARRFLFQLKNDVKAQYGIDLNLNLVVDEAIRIMLQTSQFSEAEIVTAREFYSELIGQNETAMRVNNARKSGKKKHKHKKKKGQELVLPNKMAAGYVCMLGGALLCILPFGFTQALGGTLALGGLTLIVAGSAEGERPYHIDSETGEVSPITPILDPSFGIGSQF